jgi:pyridoxal phosphate enzyme (YggS family)
MNSLAQFEKSLSELRQELAEYCQKYGRTTDSVSILPVTKRQPLEAVHYAKNAGFLAVGENVVQEGKRKSDELSGGILWELIGHLQSNKAKIAVETFDRIQSVDSQKLIRKLDRLAEEYGKTQRILIQVNTAEDPAKHGIQPQEAKELVKLALESPNLVLEGFMTIGRLSDDPLEAEKAFMELRELRDRMELEFGHSFPELSMGMSGDLEMAVKSGSTMVRVGTRLFGVRTPA